MEQTNGVQLQQSNSNQTIIGFNDKHDEEKEKKDCSIGNVESSAVNNESVNHVNNVDHPGLQKYETLPNNVDNDTKTPVKRLRTRVSRSSSSIVQGDNISVNNNVQRGHKRKCLQNGDRSKRVRQQYQPFQSPDVSISTSSINSSKIKEKERLIIYNFGDFLAVRNESNSFFLCRAKQNVYKNGRKIKIQWYNNDANLQVYSPDFYDHIDFECILTNIRVSRLEKGEVSLPEQEKQRIHNILERAINVEKGINEPPDPRKVLKDGLDISIIGKVEEEDVLNKINYKSEKTKNKTNQVPNDTTKISSNKLVNGDNTESIVNSDKKGSKTSKSMPKDDNEKSLLQCSSKSNKSSVLNNNDNDSTITQDDQITEISLIKFEEHFKKESNTFKDIEDKDSMFETNTEIPFISTYVNSKLLIRAVILKDHKYLSNLTKEYDPKICSITIPRSIFIKNNAIHYAIISEEASLLNLIIEIGNKNLVDYTYHIDSMELYHSELMQDQKSYQNSFFKFLDKSYAKFCIKTGVSLNFILKIFHYFENKLESFTENILHAIKTGNCDLSFLLAQEIAKTNQNNFDQSHLKFLKPSLTEEIDFSSLNQCINFAWKLFPIHLAAMNPDPYLFCSIITNSPDQLYLEDSNGWMPIHYASVCKTFFNIQYLLNIGVSTLLFDNDGNTPLHLATRSNRIENVALIVRTELSHSSISASLRSYNKKGWTPLHIACKKGFVKIVLFLLENNAEIDIVTSNSSGELTPLMIAAQYGHIKVVKLLIENDANINLFDKKNRGALTYAVINGHSNIVNCLLNHGANPACKDIFGNNLFHYALAYGWHFCYELLLRTNVNLKDTNAFGLSAICAAFMKGHIGIIENILKRHILSVNVPVNDSGITLVMLTFSLYPNMKLIQYLKMFVEKFRCDLCKKDYDGNNTFFYLLKCEAKYTTQNSFLIHEVIDEAICILLENGCDPFVANNAGVTPVQFALQNNCFITFTKLFKEHFKSVRFQQILLESEHFWQMIISHVLCEISVNGSRLTIGKYLRNMCEHNKNIHNLLKKMRYKSNKNGDLPIECFLKSTKQLKNTPSDISKDKMDEELTQFFEFLLKFYDAKFVEDLSLLHTAAKYSTPHIVKFLTNVILNIEVLNQCDYTPLAVAIQSDNISAAQILIESKASLQCSIDDETCFIYALKHNSSFQLIPMFIEYGVDINQTDCLGNTALHLICYNLEKCYSKESILAVIQKGLDPNLLNHNGETPLHIAFKSNQVSSNLCIIFDILQKHGSDLKIQDKNGFNPFYYLFNSNFGKNNLINVIQKINLIDYDFDFRCDKYKSSLLHYSAKIGQSACLAFMSPFFDLNALDVGNNSPLSLAILKGHKDCALILLSNSVFDIFNNYEYVRNDNSKVNLFVQIKKLNWKDVLFKIIENVKKQDKLLDLVEILIKSQCIDYAIITIKFTKMFNLPELNAEDTKRLALTYGKFAQSIIDKEIQNEFFNLFNNDIVDQIYFDLFLDGLSNWNYNLCCEMIERYTIEKILNQIKRDKINAIEKIFHNLINRNDFPNEMKELVLFIVKELSINTLSHYKLPASIHKQYSIIQSSRIEQSSDIQYSPITIAVIRGNYSIVKWLLFIQINGKFCVDVNICDSNKKTPLMHAVLNNDLKMVKLLFDRNYSYETDQDCWSDAQMKLKNTNHVDLKAKDINDHTVFHHLISPFQYSNYSKANVIFKILWKQFDSNLKTKEFINQLIEFAKEKHATNILSIIDENYSDNVPACSSNHNLSIIKLSECFKSDYLNLISKHSNSSSELDFHEKFYRSTNGKIITDEHSNMPYDVTFTKLDDQKTNYIYNFYKIQLFLADTKTVLFIKWGRVGTIGNTRRIFYDTKEEAIQDFKNIFYHKSGNEWSNIGEFVPNQDKYRIVDHKRHLKTVGFNYSFDMEQFKEKTKNKINTTKLRNFIYDIIEWNVKHWRFPDKNIKLNYNLNSSTFKDCIALLQKIYSLIIRQNLYGTLNKKEKLKMTIELIDLSEEFYGLVKIYGNQFDQLKPIITLDDCFEKLKFLNYLKSIVFNKELLFCAQSKNDIDPIDYVHDSFQFKLKHLDIDSEEFKFINLYFNRSSTMDFHDITIYEMNSSSESKVTKNNSFLLWYHPENYELFEIFVNGLKTNPIFHNSNIIFNGITLTNLIKKNERNADSLNYVILCQVKMENILELNNFESIDHSILQNKDCIVLKKNNCINTDYLQQYLFWKESTVPFANAEQTGPNEFIYMNLDKIIPRFLVEFKQG